MVEFASAAIGAASAAAVGILLAAVNHALKRHDDADLAQRRRTIEAAELVGAVRVEIATVNRHIDAVNGRISLLDTKLDEYGRALHVHNARLEAQGAAILEQSRRLDEHVEENSRLIDNIRVLKGGESHG